MTQTPLWYCCPGSSCLLACPYSRKGSAVLALPKFMLPPDPHTELPCLPVTPMACLGLGESGPQLQRMGHCPACWMEQQVWQCLQMIWLCRGVPSQPGAGWAQAGQAARCCPGVAGKKCWHTWLMWASGLVCTFSSHPEPGRSRCTHPGGCFPCSADLLPHPWLPSATWPRKRCHVVRGLLSLAYTQFGLCLGLG